MSSGLKLDPKCKSTEEPWLGEIPAHWGTAKLKHVSAERNERGYPAESIMDVDMPEYEEFLAQRCVLMAKKIKNWFGSL